MNLFSTTKKGQSKAGAAIEAVLAFDARIKALRAEGDEAAADVHAAEQRLAAAVLDEGADAMVAGDEFAKLQGRASVLKRAVEVASAQRDQKLADIAIGSAADLDAQAAALRKEALGLQSRMEPHWRAILAEEFSDKDFAVVPDLDELKRRLQLDTKSDSLLYAASRIDNDSRDRRADPIAYGRTLFESHVSAMTQGSVEA